VAVPTLNVGDVLTASFCNTWFVPRAGYKTSVTTRSTTTKSNDPDLQVTLDANAVYRVSAGINYIGSTQITTAWTTPSGATGGFVMGFNLAGTGELTNGYAWTATPNGAQAAAGSSGLAVTGMIATGGSGGTFAFQWASNAGGTNISVGVGSILEVQRIG
jgi:hypothetical protein